MHTTESERMSRPLAEVDPQVYEAILDEAERQKKLAEDHFHKARSAVDTSLTKVSESKLLNVPGLQPLRKELLESALQFYEGFLKQRSDDPGVQKDLAIAFAKVARITAEMQIKEDKEPEKPPPPPPMRGRIARPGSFR